MNICVDSGFFYALFEPRDVNHRTAIYSFDTHIDPKRASNKLLFLWPVLYEMINTRFVKFHIEKFNWLVRYLENKNLIEYIDDTEYREDCLIESLDFSDYYRNLSLVDRVIRKALYDYELRIDGVITFDPGDFIDICKQRKLRLLCQEADI